MLGQSQLAFALEWPPGVTRVPQRQCTANPCVESHVDGDIHPLLEYPDSIQFPMQDFSQGSPTGLSYLQHQKEQLSFGIGVHTGENGCAPPSSNEVWVTVILFDAERARTLTDVTAALRPGAEDRAIVITHRGCDAFIHSQFKGDAAAPTNQPGWVTASQSETWPATVASAGYGSFLELELNVTLKPYSSQGFSKVVEAGKFGLSVLHFRYGFRNDGPGGQTGFSTLNYWPGTAGLDNFSLPNFPNWLYPATWETIELGQPEPIGLTMMNYNVGLVPLKGDGGSGTVDDFAGLASQADGPEIMCFNEVWSHDARFELAELSDSMWAMQFPGKTIEHAGLPEECGGFLDVTCNPGQYIDPVFIGSGLDIQDTGLLVLAKNPIFDASTPPHEYNTDYCMGVDCLEDKGVIWARIGTQASRHVLAETGQVVYDGDEYVDVYCTHTQASCDTAADIESYLAIIQDTILLPFETIFGIPTPKLFENCNNTAIRNVQRQQFTELRDYIDQTRNPDRPAFVLGDMNADVREAEFGRDDRYGGMLDALELESLTPVDSQQSVFSKRYDIGLGCKNQPAGGHPFILPPNCDPILTPDVAAFDQSHPGPDWPYLGVGSTFNEGSQDTECGTGYTAAGAFDAPRFDHILVIPAKPEPGKLPEFAVLKDPEPYLVIDRQQDPDTILMEEGECWSDHKSVTAIISIGRVREKLSFNPAATHEMTYAIKRVETDSEDNWGGEDFYGKMSVLGPLPGETHNYNPGVIGDQDTINPNWGITKMCSQTDQLRFNFDLWEEDTVNDDHYDTVFWEDKRSRSVFTHNSSLWVFVDDKGKNRFPVCFEQLSPFCVGLAVGSTNIVVDTEGLLSESAKVKHQLVAKELE